MKLDTRIIEGKRPLSCIDTDEAKQFIDKEGYFAKDVSMYQNLDYFIGNLSVRKNIECFKKWTLQEIKDNAHCCFKDNILNEWWNYFLPAEWVKEKEPEPVWKPYDLDSWRNDNFRIGSAITFRIKPKNEQDSKNLPVKTMIYLGREERSDDLDNVSIYIGPTAYSFQYLFEHYEIFDDKYEKLGCPKWRPFGYQE